MDRVLIVQSLDGVRIAEVREAPRAQFVVDTDDPSARSAIDELISRGRKVGLLHSHDHRQRTTNGEVFRMYGRWSKPGEPDFLDALADALMEFDLVGFTVEVIPS